MYFEIIQAQAKAKQYTENLIAKLQMLIKILERRKRGKSFETKVFFSQRQTGALEGESGNEIEIFPCVF